jgi:hypothetical protein
MAKIASIKNIVLWYNGFFTRKCSNRLAVVIAIYVYAAQRFIAQQNIQAKV